MATQLASRILRKSRSLAVQLVSTLQARIKDGTYVVGMRMPTEAEIMVEHGVSRTVVREAISRLQQAQLVVTQHGIGSFVSELSQVAPRGRKSRRLSLQTHAQLQHIDNINHCCNVDRIDAEARPIGR